MTINERWRICFEFRKGCAYEVEIAARNLMILACEARPQ
jgi:plasmid maintenance system killer protein